MKPRKRFIAYYRVSTERHGKSGLGLEAQRKLVKEFCGDDWPPVVEFTEIESGKNDCSPNWQRHWPSVGVAALPW
jgi:DNA invertase Pin-like site-specific DNA recombinase